MNVQKPLSLVFFGALIISSCTSSSIATPIPEEPAAMPVSTPTSVGPYKFNIATGMSSSAWYAIGSELVPAINNNASVVRTEIKETQSLMENVDLLTSGKAGMAVVFDYHVALANQGRLMSAFPNAPEEKLTIKCGTEMIRPMFPDYSEPARIVLPIYDQHLIILAHSESGIKTISDIKGKHISTGELDSATEQQVRFIFTGLGLDWDNDVVRESYDLFAAMVALQLHQIDALFWSAPVIDVEMAELINSVGGEIVFVSIQPDETKRIMDASPGVFHPGQIPGGTYTGQTANIDTLATTVVLATMEDFPAQHIGEILAAIYGDPSNRFALSLDNLSPESMLYLHQGALDYYKKQGFIK